MPPVSGVLLMKKMGSEEEQPFSLFSKASFGWEKGVRERGVRLMHRYCGEI
jgi:hypothetical protein